MNPFQIPFHIVLDSGTLCQAKLQINELLLWMCSSVFPGVSNTPLLVSDSKHIIEVELMSIDSEVDHNTFIASRSCAVCMCNVYLAVPYIKPYCL